MGKIGLLICTVVIFGVILGSEAERGGEHGGQHGGNRRPPPGFGLGFGSGVGCSRGRYFISKCHNSTTTTNTTTESPGGRPHPTLLCSECFDNAVQVCTRKPPTPPNNNGTAPVAP